MTTKLISGRRLNFIDPKIELIGSLDLRKDVWRISRPHLDPNDPSINDIQNLDLPVNGFATYCFSITSNILLRDLLYHVRPSHDWARSNRTTLIDESTMVYSSEYDDESFWTEVALREHDLSIDQSVNQDIRKSHFLYYASTDYCWMVDARTLSGVIRSLLTTPLAFYAELMLESLGMESVDELVPGYNNFFYQYAIDDVLLQKYEGVSDNAIVHYYPEARQLNVTAKMTGNLLSQFIRQAYSVVRTSLVNDVLNAKSVYDLPITQDKIFIGQSLMATEKAKKVVLTRSCFFAAFDSASLSSWSHIVVAIRKALNMTPAESLICNGDHTQCKWKAEQLARTKAGNTSGSRGEVNPPCPFIVGLPEMQELRGLKFNSNSELYHDWDNFIPATLEPTEEGVEYLNNVAHYGYAETKDNNDPVIQDFTERLITKYKHLIK